MQNQRNSLVASVRAIQQQKNGEWNTLQKIIFSDLIYNAFWHKRENEDD